MEMLDNFIVKMAICSHDIKSMHFVFGADLKRYYRMAAAEVMGGSRSTDWQM